MFISKALFSALCTLSAHSTSALTLPKVSCDISGGTIAGLPSTLAQPSSKATFVAIALGTQNYTCSESGTYASAGAVAQLFDISCLYKTPLFDKIADLVMMGWEAAPLQITADKIVMGLQGIGSPLVLGQHYFVPNPVTGQGISPKWDFSAQGKYAGNKDAFVTAAKVTGAPAPTGSQDIDWVQLKSIAGGLAQEVYRTDTRLGQPPTSCQPGSAPITVRYVSKYWLFGGTVKK